MKFDNIMKQAKEMQKNMEALQERLLTQTAEGSSGAGMVKATVNGKGDVLSLVLDPALLNPEEREILEDLIIIAIQDAKAKADEISKKEMATVTGGLTLPGGMKFPF